MCVRLGGTSNTFNSYMANHRYQTFLFELVSSPSKWQKKTWNTGLTRCVSLLEIPCVLIQRKNLCESPKNLKGIHQPSYLPRSTGPVFSPVFHQPPRPGRSAPSTCARAGAESSPSCRSSWFFAWKSPKATCKHPRPSSWALPTLGQEIWWDLGKIMEKNGKMTRKHKGTTL